MLTFAERLAAAVRLKKTPAIVGLDPRWESLPVAISRTDSIDDQATRALCFAKFCREIIDVVAQLVPAVKPQSAFFEQLGPPGMAALHDVIAYARAQKLLIIVDAKRNDIGSTAEAYAAAFFGPKAPFRADALTISPYLGDDSVSPFLNAARQDAAGLFILVKTSNPGGRQFQDLDCGGRRLYEHVAEYVERLAAADADVSAYGSAGAVVGATYPDQLAELRSIMSHAWLLIPGYGSQGGNAADVAGGFDALGLGALVNNSRGIIFAHREPMFTHFGEVRWQQAVEAATKEMIAALAAETPAGRLC
jgi:orotidine-5'-phosphate decarboxylase